MEKPQVPTVAYQSKRLIKNCNDLLGVIAKNGEEGLVELGGFEKGRDENEEPPATSNAESGYYAKFLRSALCKRTYRNYFRAVSYQTSVSFLVRCWSTLKVISSEVYQIMRAVLIYLENVSA